MAEGDGTASLNEFDEETFALMGINAFDEDDSSMSEAEEPSQANVTPATPEPMRDDDPMQGHEAEQQGEPIKIEKKGSTNGRLLTRRQIDDIQVRVDQEVDDPRRRSRGPEILIL